MIILSGKRIALMALMVVGLMLLSSVAPALASTEINLGTAYYLNTYSTIGNGRDDNTVNRPQSRILQHSTGKIAILQFIADNADPYINLYSATGTLLSSTALPKFGSSIFGGVTLAEYSSTQIIIAYATINCKANFILFNVNTYTLTPYSSSAMSSGTPEDIARQGNLYYYNGIWWVMYLYRINGSDKCSWAKFTVATLTASYNTAISYDHYGYTSEIMGFQDSSNLNLIYIVSSEAGLTASYQSTPQYYVFDCSTGLMTLLATNGINAVLPDAAIATYTQPYSNMITYLGGGIYHSGTYYYLYHSWIYSIGTSTSSPAVRTYQIVMWYGKFNNTITSGSLITQVCIHRTITDNSGGTYNTPGSSYGVIAYDKATLPKLEFDLVVCRPLGGYYMEGVIFGLNDITQLHTDFDTLGVIPGVDNKVIAYKAEDANMARNPLYTWSYQEDSISSYLFLNERAILTIVTETLTYSPIDNPLIQGKTYSFIWVIYKNGIVDINGTDKYTVYFDNYPAKSGTLDSNGRAIVSVTSSLMGDHILSIDVWDSTNTMIYHGPDHTYTWSASTGGGGSNPTGTIVTGWYNLAVVWFPIFGFIVLPMLAVGFMGARFAGGIGMMLGLIFGGFGGVVAGVQILILPIYVLYLYIFLIGVGLVLIIMNGRGNSG